MKTIEINSSQNTTFKRFLRLKNPRDIRKHERALLSGPKQIREVLREFPDRCTGIIFSSRHDVPDFPGTGAIPRYCLSPDLFSQVDCFGTKQPVLIVRAEAFPHFDGAMDSLGLTLCVPFQDPRNVGAVIRTSAAFGVTRIVFLKEAAHPFHPKSVRVAGSSIFRIPFYQGPALSRLGRYEMPLIIMSAEGKDVAQFEFPESFCLVPGLEGPGIPETLQRARKVSIPMANGIESLNVAMATGIMLYLWRNKEVKSRDIG
ncbi:MAG: RNA methyltransferase [Deltaproteobacteria bacterium]|nr:RNA methyltransferase [Deltaproteobacteria bacterium]